MSTKQKNFRLPLDIIERLDNDERNVSQVVIDALKREYGMEDEVPVDPEVQRERESFIRRRVSELGKTLPPATAQRIAELEAS